MKRHYRLFQCSTESAVTTPEVIIDPSAEEVTATKIRVLAGFPGCGKSTLTVNNENEFIDLDSALFPKDDEDRFVKYVDRVEELLKATNKGILVSTHFDLLTELTKRNIDVMLVFPVREGRENYIQRYISRGDWAAFLIQMIENWDRYHDEMEQAVLTNNSRKLVLSARQNVGDVISYTVDTGFVVKA